MRGRFIIANFFICKRNHFSWVALRGICWCAQPHVSLIDCDNDWSRGLEFMTPLLQVKNLLCDLGCHWMSLGPSCLIRVAMAVTEATSFVNQKAPSRQLVWSGSHSGHQRIPCLMECVQKDSWVLWREGERSHPFTVSAKEVEWRGNWAPKGTEESGNECWLSEIGVSTSLRQACKQGRQGQPPWLHLSSPSPCLGSWLCEISALCSLDCITYMLLYSAFSSQSLESLCLPFPFWNAAHSSTLSSNATSSMKPFLISPLSLYPLQFYFLDSHCPKLMLLW